MRSVMLCMLIFVMTGCATRTGSSSKLSNYNEKLHNVAVSYKGESFINQPVNKKLGRYDIQKLDQYILKATPQVFADAGIQAGYKAFGTDMVASMMNEKQPLIIISPANALTRRSASNESQADSEPSFSPVTVGFHVLVFDPSVNKNVWTGDFSVVVGGLYGGFDEKLTASLLNSIIEKLTDDGLIEKDHPLDNEKQVDSSRHRAGLGGGAVLSRSAMWRQFEDL